MSVNVTALDPMKRAQEGAALLDEKRPGWWKQIDTDRLNIASPYQCVLGQLYGTYGEGLEAVKLLCECWMTPGTFCDYARLGFSGWGNEDYTPLNDAWKRIVKYRIDRNWPVRSDIQN